MSILKLKDVVHENKVSRGGKSYVSCKLVVADKTGKDLWISGFGSNITKTWQAGDEVDVSLSQTEKGYWNFEENENSKPSPDKKLILLEEINKKLDILIGGEKKVSEPNGQMKQKGDEGYVDPEAIPF